MKSIVIITSGQPAINPRLVKEADALTDAGYEVRVIYQFRDHWASELDRPILKESKWSAVCIGGNPQSSKFTYWASKLAHKIGKVCLHLFGLRDIISELALGRCTFLLAKKAETFRADLYIAHNLAALPAAVRAAKKNKARSGFDAEDFHRYEASDDLSSIEVKLKAYIEDKYLDHLDYFTTASPLISAHYKSLYPFLEPTTILNVFPKQLLTARKLSNDHTLRLFWFSQTIGRYRGLEEVIAAIGLLKVHPIELHLLGNVNDEVKNYFSALLQPYDFHRQVLFYYPPMPATMIFSFAQQFDVGLATELSIPSNRDLCLTNKIFTYIQAGLAVLCSPTSAQKELMEKYPGMGLVYERNNVAAQLSTYISDKSLLQAHKAAAYVYAQSELNWEKEKEKFLAKIQHVIR